MSEQTNAGPTATTEMRDWTLPGSTGETIHGTTHLPAGPPRAVVLIAHGFKGYKDYGMFPYIAEQLARAGCVAHRFNFAHSGMAAGEGDFERLDLFERDTWSRQVEDLACLGAAIADGVLPGAASGSVPPLVLFGHSRGGVASLLAAGRGAIDPAAIVTAAAPAQTAGFPPAAALELQRSGFLETPSARTGQTLRIGLGFLKEMQDDPAGHDLLALVARLTCPLTVVHGLEDPSVPSAAGNSIAAAATCTVRLVLIDGANHVFDTPNPFPVDGTPARSLQALVDATIAQIDAIAEQVSGH